MNCTTSDGTPAVPACAPASPHPHMERRYLVVPGMRSSRIHILDTKPDPRSPTIVKVIEAVTLARVGPSHAQTSPAARPRRRAADGPRTAPGSQSDRDLRIRRGGDVSEGF